MSTNPEIKTAAKHSPITSRRKPATNAARHIDRAGVARANVAVSAEAPTGTADWADAHKDLVTPNDHFFLIFFWKKKTLT